MIDMIHFYKVKDLENVRKFYEDLLKLPLYKDQGACLIYDVGHGKIGFCTHHPIAYNEATCITFVYASRSEVDAMHTRLKPHVNVGNLSYNERFKIYHFFAKDFENLTVEFQVFED